MILLNDFFKILSVEESTGKYTVAVSLNAGHEIFKGHFPGQPVVPGVCMVQMMKETMGHIYNRRFTMKSAAQLKFLAILNPGEVSELNIEINTLKEDAEGLSVSGTFHKGELIFLKFRAFLVFAG